jgi:hypothetical protein
MLGGHNQSSAHHHNQKLSAKCLLAESIRLLFFYKTGHHAGPKPFLIHLYSLITKDSNGGLSQWRLSHKNLIEATNLNALFKRCTSTENILKNI